MKQFMHRTQLFSQILKLKGATVAMASFVHCSDVIISKSQGPRVFTQPFSQAQIKEYIKASRASLAFVRGIHRSPANSLYKGPVTRKMLPFDDVIMVHLLGYNIYCIHCICFWQRVYHCAFLWISWTTFTHTAVSGIGRELNMVITISEDIITLVGYRQAQWLHLKNVIEVISQQCCSEFTGNCLLE